MKRILVKSVFDAFDYVVDHTGDETYYELHYGNDIEPIRFEEKPCALIDYTSVIYNGEKAVVILDNRNQDVTIAYDTGYLNIGDILTYDIDQPICGFLCIKRDGRNMLTDYKLNPLLPYWVEEFIITTGNAALIMHE